MDAGSEREGDTGGGLPDAAVGGVSAEGVMAALDHALAGACATVEQALLAASELARVEAMLASRRVALAAAVYYTHAADAHASLGAAGADGTAPGNAAAAVADHDVDSMDLAVGALGAALTRTPSAARDSIGLGRMLTEHFQRVGQALAAGDLDEATARVIVAELEEVSCDAAPALEADAVARATGPAATRIRGRRLANHLRRRVAEEDPHNVRERRTRALARRRVTLTPLRNGLCRIEAVVSADAAQMIDTALENLARTSPFEQLHPEPDKQTKADRRAAHGRRRADALVELCASAFLAPEERGAGPLAGVTAVEFVTAPGTATASAGRSTSPKSDPPPRWLNGHGWLPGGPPEPLTPTTPWAVTTKPIDPGREPTPEASLRYRIPTWLDTQVRLRDGHCAFPGCGTPASRCDLDHLTPFDHAHPTHGGPTTGDNLSPECRFHHRLKTHGGWSATRGTARGVVVVTSPTGERYVSRPDGPLGLRPAHDRLSGELDGFDGSRPAA